MPSAISQNRRTKFMRAYRTLHRPIVVLLRNRQRMLASRTPYPYRHHLILKPAANIRRTKPISQLKLLYRVPVTHPLPSVLPNPENKKCATPRPIRDCITGVLRYLTTRFFLSLTARTLVRGCACSGRLFLFHSGNAFFQNGNNDFGVEKPAHNR